MMSECKLRTLKRVVGSADERLPLKEFLAVSRKQVDAMPLEIVEQGVMYHVTDVKMHIQGSNKHGYCYLYRGAGED